MNNSIHTKLINREEKLAVIGLGYVGLPIALEFAKKMNVVGFDINPKRVEMMKNNIDPSNELSAEAFENKTIEFTASIQDLKEVKFFVVAVPTPIDEFRNPDLKPLLSASETVGKVLKKGDYVVFESTVYPGCTEEDCVPVLEEFSGLGVVEDFKVGYSPERINPGDTIHTLANVVKVVSGCDEESLEEIAKVYEEVVGAGVHRASSIKVAEAAKIIENTQRDVNISLINELSIIFNRLNINTYEVLEAAGTKWNFLNFRPGLVGGHCIGVDPYYLTYKAEQVGYHSRIILAGRQINDDMGRYVVENVVKKLVLADVPVRKSRVGILGFTFKEDTPDTRNTRVIDIVDELKEYGISPLIVDPIADENELKEEYNLKLNTLEELRDMDAIIVAVGHKEFLKFEQTDFDQMFKDTANNEKVLVDVKS